MSVSLEFRYAKYDVLQNENVCISSKVQLNNYNEDNKTLSDTEIKPDTTHLQQSILNIHG